MRRRTNCRSSSSPAILKRTCPPPFFAAASITTFRSLRKTNGWEQIVASRLGEFRDLESPLLAEGIQFFRYLREGEAGLQKLPATAELLDWLVYLTQRGADLKKGLRQQESLVKPSLVTLLKHEQDQKRSEELWNGWLTRKV